MFLSAQSPNPIHPILIERHPSHSLHPRAIGYTPRTLEIFRTAAIADKLPPSNVVFNEIRRANIESLAGRWYEESEWTPQHVKKDEKSGDEGMEFSPTKGTAIAQDALEPILKERAVELGADIRFGTKLLSLEQNDEGVTAKVMDADRREYIIRAEYLVAADGTHSQVRESLAIRRKGQRNASPKRSVLFRADLQQYLEKGVVQFTIDWIKKHKNIFLTTYGDDRWVLVWDDEQGNNQYEEAEFQGLIEAVIGRSDIPFEIITTGRWDVNALIADRFRDGRVFLAGDAAHTLPPSRGGYGVNTGIHDGHNLAWKLAAVVSGASSPALLTTYEAERRPVALLRYQQLYARSDWAHRDDDEDALLNVYKEVGILEDSAVELGQLYRSAAVLGVGDNLPPAQRPDHWAGQPGTRVPHIPVTRNGGELASSIDLFGFSWTLIAEDERWAAAADETEQALGIRVAVVRVGQDVEFSSLNAFRETFGVGRSGASLVRPDGYIAWRVVEASAHPAKQLMDALTRVSLSVRECARR
ncbi:MAG: hypothetical protein M1822_005430 [Bathelium mastoideum]|nr:MAG: hypothetical protein M1822_005430 [Bathelium mastoideum]